MKSHEFINETTSAGGIATVVGGMAPTITRNSSIYGKTEVKEQTQKTYGDIMAQVQKANPDAPEKELRKIADDLHRSEVRKHEAYRNFLAKQQRQNK